MLTVQLSSIKPTSHLSRTALSMPFLYWNKYSPIIIFESDTKNKRKIQWHLSTSRIDHLVPPVLVAGANKCPEKGLKICFTYVPLSPFFPSSLPPLSLSLSLSLSLFLPLSFSLVENLVSSVIEHIVAVEALVWVVYLIRDSQFCWIKIISEQWPGTWDILFWGFTSKPDGMCEVR